MITDIINKIRKSDALCDSEREYLDAVLKQPHSPDFVQLWLAGLV